MRGLKKWITTATYFVLAVVTLFNAIVCLLLGSLINFASMLVITLLCLSNIVVFWPRNDVDLRVTCEKGSVIPKGTVFKSAKGTVIVVTQKEVTIK